MISAEELQNLASAVPTHVERYLHPGELFISTHPTRVTTILGSCVAACLFDREGTLAGINHFLLPTSHTGAASSTRYGDVAMNELIGRLIQLGAPRGRLLAKLFGGANVLHAFSEGVRHIGAANVELARSALARHDIPVVAEHVGGTRGRKLVFTAPEGAAWVRMVGP